MMTTLGVTAEFSLTSASGSSVATEAMTAKIVKYLVAEFQQWVAADTLDWQVKMADVKKLQVDKALELQKKTSASKKTVVDNLRDMTAEKAKVVRSKSEWKTKCDAAREAAVLKEGECSQKDKQIASLREELKNKTTATATTACADPQHAKMTTEMNKLYKKLGAAQSEVEKVKGGEGGKGQGRRHDGCIEIKVVRVCAR
jgi:hypothetical protein